MLSRLVVFHFSSYCWANANAFMPVTLLSGTSNSRQPALPQIVVVAPLAGSSSSSETVSSATPTTTPAAAAAAPSTCSIDPKETVKIFGRLADKYILLDSSGGMCCYSACKDCEFRLPDGGYRMADQSASRPKWICAYDERNFPASGKEHSSKWSLEIYQNGPAVTKEQFIQAVTDMPYNPPLGGPYVGASSAAIEDTSAVAYFFDLLAGDKEKLTKHRMGKRLKELAGDEEGMTWAAFSQHMTTTPQ